MNKIINLDCDGTWIDLYGVSGWKNDLDNMSIRPYIEAKPLVNLSLLSRVINKLQRQGYEINIISWLAKNSSSEYDKAVLQAKLHWLKKHIPSVHWNNIYIVPYGTPKSTLSSGILFDDEVKNREDWGENAYDEKDLITKLKSFL